ncbi:MAG: VWA domain-containing protein [Acidimicrobiia bacterium]|nr:VWA domain-containing protein [Acidimicrobiia bacterium]
MTGRVWLVACALCLFGSVLLAPATSGQEGEDAAVLLILDASGSMNSTDDNGVRLIDGAQQALTRLVEILPEGAPVGLRVYGHRVPNTDKTNGCLDTELIVPVGPLEKGSMIDAIGSFSARGFTPIGLSLEEAASDLSDGRGTIILVSDGEDTCAPPDPCDVAAGLVSAGIDVQVHTVGFFLGEGDPARAQLQCIADATGASYRDVDAIDSLTGELGQIVVQSLPGLGNIPVPIAGALVRTAAPTLNLGVAPGGHPPGSGFGAYQAALAPGQTVWYAVELDGPSFLSVGGDLSAFVPGAQPGDTMEMVITDDSGAEVHLWDSRWGRSSVVLTDIDDPQRVGFGASTGIGFDNPWSVMSAEERWPVEILGYDEESHDATMRELVRRPEPPLAGPGTYYIGFTWNSDAQLDPASIGFLITTWPISDSIHLQYALAAGAQEAAGALLLRPTGYVRGPIQPGPSDGDLQGGYFGDIERGATIWYSVHLEVDEALSVRGFLNRPEGASAGSGETFGVEIYDPEMRLVTRQYEDRESTLDLADPTALDASFLPHGLAPRPLAGGATPSLLGESDTTEGTHFIAFTWDGPADGTSAELEFILNVHGAFDGAAGGGDRLYLVGSLDRLAAPFVDVGLCPGSPDAYCFDLSAVIRPGETRWYQVEAPEGLSVMLEAEFVPPAGYQPGADDHLRLSIIDVDGNDVTFDHEQAPAALDLNFVEEVANPRAQSVCPGCDPPPPAYARGGLHYLGVTWESEAEPVDAELILQVEMAPVGEDLLPPGEEVLDAADSGPDRGRELVVLVATLLVAGGGAWLLWRRFRRRAATPE